MDVKPGYKRTELGIIPKDWGVAPLGECLVTRPSYGINAPAVPYSDRLPVYIRITDITDDGRFLPSPLVSVRSEFVGSYFLADGDIVFARTGASVGKSYKYKPEDGAMVYAGFLIRVTPDSNRLIPEFAAAYFMTGHYWRWVRIMSMRSGQPGINGKEYAQLPLPLPSLSEQRAIATALSDVDALITKLDQLIAKKRDIKQAAMQQLLTGKTRLPGFSGEWEVKQFGGVLERLNAKGSQIQTCQYQMTGRYPVIDQGQEPIVGFSDLDDRLINCPDGGVIVFGDHTCIAKFVDVDFIVGADGTQVIKAKGGHVTQFYAYHLQHKGVKPTGYNRHFKYLRGREFLVPPWEEQTAIATVLSDMDAEIAALEARRDKTRAIKQGVMQVLLTGQVRLPVSTEPMEALA